MGTIRLLLRWLLRAWPFLLFSVILTLHYWVYLCFPNEITYINKVAATVLQVLGGLIVLYSINQNIGLFKRQNLLTIAADWLRSFPLIKRNVTLQVEPITAVASVSAELSVTRKCDTVEEKLAELQRQVDECRQAITRKEKKINERISAVEASLSNRIAQNGRQIAEVRSLLHDSVVGGISTQVFGVLLVVYGAVLGML